MDLRYRKGMVDKVAQVTYPLSYLAADRSYEAGLEHGRTLRGRARRLGRWFYHSGEEFYLFGECWILAEALARHTGGTAVYVALEGELTHGHAMCRLPDGRYVDVRGIHAAGSDPRKHYPVELSPGLVTFAPDRTPENATITPVTQEHVDAWGEERTSSADWMAGVVLAHLELAD